MLIKKNKIRIVHIGDYRCIMKKGHKCQDCIYSGNMCGFILIPSAFNINMLSVRYLCNLYPDYVIYSINKRGT